MLTHHLSRSNNIFDPVKVAKNLPKKPSSDFVVDEGKIDETAVKREHAEGG